MSAPTQAPPEARPTNQALVLLRGLGGAIGGGIAGYLLFYWLSSKGLYGIMVIGALIGFGAGLASRGRSVTLGVICALVALPTAILSEWHVMPFVKDQSLSLFLVNLSAAHWLFIAFGVAAAYWFGQGR
jgi:hypothetical protein